MPTNPLRRITLMSRQRKIVTGLGAVGVAGAVVLGGASLASADTTTSTTPRSSSSSSSDTAVTGAEATKVSAAVTGEDSAVTVTEVRKDPDGSYDVLGTKAGAEVFYDVSSDLATVTLNAGHGGDHADGDGETNDDTTGATGASSAAA